MKRARAGGDVSSSAGGGSCVLARGRTPPYHARTRAATSSPASDECKRQAATPAQTTGTGSVHWSSLVSPLARDGSGSPSRDRSCPLGRVPFAASLFVTVSMELATLLAWYRLRVTIRRRTMTMYGVPRECPPPDGVVDVALCEPWQRTRDYVRRPHRIYQQR